MPYIRQEKRGEIDFVVKDGIHERRIVSFHEPQTPGELNYIFFQILLETFPARSYTEYNEVMGVLECVKQEYYRRLVAPYEEQAKYDNGDLND